MPSTITTDWLALKARIDTLVTAPNMQRFEPGDIIRAPAQTEKDWNNEEPWSNGQGFDAAGLPMPFIAISDVVNDPDRGGISGVASVRSGTLMLSVMWPIARAVSHIQLKEVAGQIAAHFPEDLCMSYGPSRLRVTQDSAAMQAYIDGAYRVAVVRVFWSSM